MLRLNVYPRASGERIPERMIKMKNSNNDFSIDEAVRTLSAFGLDEVMKVLKLSDENIIDLLLDDCEIYHNNIMEWFANYLNDSAIELNENKYL